PLAWQALPSWHSWALLCLMGLLGTVGHFLLILAYRRAPASTLTPYLYAQIGFAMLGGWWVFGQVPDAASLMGIALITVCGAAGACPSSRSRHEGQGCRPHNAAMAQHFEVHPDNPQPRLLKQAAALLARGEVLAVPTDSSYALACRLDDKDAADTLRRIRQVDERHHLTLLCRDLSELANYARVDNRQRSEERRVGKECRARSPPHRENSTDEQDRA